MFTAGSRPSPVGAARTRRRGRCRRSVVGERHRHRHRHQGEAMPARRVREGPNGGGRGTGVVRGSCLLRLESDRPAQSAPHRMREDLCQLIVVPAVMNGAGMGTRVIHRWWVAIELVHQVAVQLNSCACSGGPAVPGPVLVGRLLLRIPCLCRGLAPPPPLLA